MSVIFLPATCPPNSEIANSTPRIPSAPSAANGPVSVASAPILISLDELPFDPLLSPPPDVGVVVPPPQAVKSASIPKNSMSCRNHRLCATIRVFDFILVSPHHRYWPRLS